MNTEPVDIDWLANPIREAYDGSPAEIALAVLDAIKAEGYQLVKPIPPDYTLVLPEERDLMLPWYAFNDMLAIYPLANR